MGTFRLAAVGLVCSAAALGSAAAQTASPDDSGKPLPLLQFVRHANAHATARADRTRIRGETTHHARQIAKRTRHATRFVKREHPRPHAASIHVAAAIHPASIHVAAAIHPTAVHPAAIHAAAPRNLAAERPAPAQPLPAALPTTLPPADAVMPAAIQTAAPAPADSYPPVDRRPDTVAAGNETAAPVWPDAGNSPNVAADDPPDAATPAASNAAARHPAFRAMIASAASKSSSPVGSFAWISQVLAALGGAIAAGALAWFLIRPTLRRTNEATRSGGL